MEEKTYEVSVPMFVLPFVKVKATSAEEAQMKGLEEIKYRLGILFPKNDNRPMEDGTFVVDEVPTEA